MLNTPYDSTEDLLGTGVLQEVMYPYSKNSTDYYKLELVRLLPFHSSDGKRNFHLRDISALYL